MIDFEQNFDPRKEVHFSDAELEGVIRPKEFEDFSGQDKILKSSGIKLFSKNGITADCLLPYNEFVLYSDLLKRDIMK